MSTWAETAAPGAPAAISGPARGIEIDPGIERYVLLGDETALPALSQLLEVLDQAGLIGAGLLELLSEMPAERTIG